MDQGTGGKSASGRHIIQRPRLTQLLDSTESSLILLVAPAGYGKTTLARQWASRNGRVAIWHEVTTASADVAVLAASVARALSRLFPEAADLVADRLRASREAEADPDLLADALAARVPRWPDDTWLILDDYQNLMDSPDAERFISGLTSFTHLLIVGRRRPTWMTARRLLYGETREVGANALAITDAEAAAILQLPSDEAASGLVSLASGWPAVIGLAALTPRSLATVREELPETLHDYFAEELYQAFPDSLKSGLLELSLAPTITSELAAALVGGAAQELLENAAIHGFLTPSPGGRSDFHPLLRQFLRSKLDLSNSQTLERIDSLISYLISTRAWDDAFTMIELADRLDLLTPLLDAALDDVLRRGRVATVRRWLAVVKTRGAISPQIDLARAEVSFREGRHTEAEMQALDAARGLPTEHALHSRALYRAAQSAQLADRAGDALRLHQEAARTATTTTDQRQAIGDNSLRTPSSENAMKHSQR
jgi:ATP/maltotriose-dependent transcriptional regulator MalT